MSVNVVISPNMTLPVPVVSVDPGPDWANNVNSCLGIIDQHNHAPGSGVQINPAGININSDLTFNDNNLTLVRSVRFDPQTAPISLPADIGCLYESGVDLYYNDGNGNQVRMTSGGSVAGAAGTITGLPSGTASASYAAGTFVFQAATATPATLDAASIILRNNVANSKGLTLSPPAAMGSNFTLTLPSIPAATAFLQVDTSGNITGAIPVAQGITATNIAPNTITTNQISLTAGITGTQLANQTITALEIANATITTTQIAAATILGSNIAAATITGSNLVNNTITATQIASGTITTTQISATAGIVGGQIAAATITRANIVAPGQQVSTTASGSSTTSITDTPITHMTVTITTTGNPVMLLVQGGINEMINGSGAQTADFNFYRGSTKLTTSQYYITSGAVFGSIASQVCLDVIGAGTYTYTLQYSVSASTCQASSTGSYLVAYEIM